MNRKEFLTELSLALVRIPDAERKDALNFYNEYLDEVGLDGEEDAIAELGSVKEIAARINAENAIKNMEENPRSAKKGLSAVWIVILAVLSTPITIPLALCIVAFIVTVICCAVGVIVGIWAGALGSVVGGVAMIVLTITEGVTPMSSVMLTIGGGIAAVGAGVLLILFAFWLSRLIVIGIAYLCRSILNKSKSKNKKESATDE